MKRILAALTCYFASALFAAALDISGAIHVDTYNGKPTVGFSALAQEDFSEAVSLSAKVEYLSANSYKIQTLVLGQYKFLAFGGGLALTTNNADVNIIIPGLSFFLAADLPKRLGLEGAAILSLAPSNLYAAYGFDVSARLLYSTDNADAFLGYRLRQEAQQKGFIHGIEMEVNAFEIGVPFTLMLGIGFDLAMVESSIGMDLHVSGGFSIPTGRFGTYFSKVKVTPMTYKQSTGIPFDIAVGVAFNL